MVGRAARLRHAATLAAVAAAAACGVALGVAALDVRVADPGWRTGLVVVATSGAAVAGACLALLARRRPGAAADTGVVLAAAWTAGLSVAALDGTRWGWYGLFGDSAFRSQMATRYAEHLALVDYGYRGLPAYYPPAVGWLQGRVADLAGIPGWAALKPVQVAFAVLVPLLAYALWRQVVRPPAAAAVGALTALWAAHPQKPDEWLVVVCLVPWWLMAVRDLRAPGMARWPAWGLGLVLGLLLLTHTYYFLPMGVATLLALGADVARRRAGLAPRLPVGRALAIGAVGLLVAAPYWVGAVAARLRLPSDDLQMRFAVPYGNVPPFPLPVDLRGVVGLLGVVWLVVAARRWRRTGRAQELAAGLALALLGACLTMGIGAVLVRFDVGLLTFKTADLVEVLLLAAGVLGAAEALSRVARAAPPRAAAAVAAVSVAVGCAAAVHHLATEWATGDPALVAQTTRYPDGTFPEGGRGLEPVIPVLHVRPGDPSVEEVLDAWDRLQPGLPHGRTVLVTSRVDLLATTPVHGFTSVKSIYSHPNGQFEARVDLLREVAACADARCAADLLRENPYDAVDGLVLERQGGDLVLPFKVDAFPDRTRSDSVVFPGQLFAAPRFERTDVGRLAVVAVRGPDGTGRD